MTPAELLEIYDAEVRAGFTLRLPPGWTATSDGPLTRCLTTRRGFAMLTEPSADLTAAELDELVERTVGYYRELGRGFEWKTFDHDRGDLRPLLVAAGAIPDAHEALVLGETRLLAGDAALSRGVRLRQVCERDDLERIAELQTTVWEEDWSWLADDLASRLSSPVGIEVFVAEDLSSGAPAVVSAAWLVPMPGTRVAGLWGGSTLSSHRGRGIYRALVARRAQRALELGHPILQVDASDDSRPILTRLGLQVVGGTQPYVFSA